MRKDIPIIEVDEIGLALIPEEDPSLGTLWVAHLVNLKEFSLKNVLVSVEGAGVVDGVDKKTSTMRYLLPEILPLCSSQIEVLLPEVMNIDHKFWMSFSHEDYMYDKKFIVTSEAIKNQPLQGIPVLHQQGLWFD